MKKARDVTTPGAEFISAEETVQEAARRMADKDLGELVEAISAAS